MSEPSTSKQVFLSSLSREEQLGTLWDMYQAVSNRQSKDTKEHIAIKNDLHFLKGEVAGIGRRNGHPTLTTSQKIDVAITKRSAALIWYRDKVLAPTLSALHLLIVMAILYLAFGGKIP